VEIIGLKTHWKKTAVRVVISDFLGLTTNFDEIGQKTLERLKLNLA